MASASIPNMLEFLLCLPFEVNYKLQTEINPLFPKLLIAEVFHHISRNKLKHRNIYAYTHTNTETSHSLFEPNYHSLIYDDDILGPAERRSIKKKREHIHFNYVTKMNFEVNLNLRSI